MNDFKHRLIKSQKAAVGIIMILSFFCVAFLATPVRADRIEGNYCKNGPDTDKTRVYICDGLPKDMMTTDITLYLHQFSIPAGWGDAGNAYEIAISPQFSVYYNPNASKPFTKVYTEFGTRDYKKKDSKEKWWSYQTNFSLLIRNVPVHGKIEIYIRMYEDDFAKHYNNDDNIFLNDIVVYPSKKIAYILAPGRKEIHDSKHLVKFGKRKRMMCDIPIYDEDDVQGMLDFTIARYDKSSRCQTYASRSIEQYNEARQFVCGFKPPIWSSDKKKHFNWCMHGVNYQYIMNNIQKRDMELEKCKKNAR